MDVIVMTRPGKLLTIATLAIAITGASCRAGSIEITQKFRLRDALAWWPLDDGEGTMVKDASESSAPYIGTTLGPTKWIPDGDGKFGGALHFEQGSEVQVGDFPATNPVPLDNWSVALWVRPTAADLTQDYATLISTEKAGMGGWEMNIHNITQAGGARSNRYEFAFYTGPGAFEYFRVDCDTCVKLDEWTHLAGVVDSVDGSVSLYVNGGKVVPVTNSNSLASAPHGPIKPGNTTLRLGSWELEATQPRWFKGDLDDIYIYKRALSYEDISLLQYHQILPTPPDAGDAGGESDGGGTDAASSPDRNPDRNPDQNPDQNSDQ